MTPAPATDYLSNMAHQLAAGVQRLPVRFRAREADYVAAAQRPDGGFAGRQGGSDLYYTSFGLQSADLLGMGGGEIWSRAARYLSATSQARDLVECFCLLRIRQLVRQHAGHAFRGLGDDRTHDLSQAVEGCRAPGGGYSILPGRPPAAYHTFLAALCSQMLGVELAGGKDLVAFLLSCRCADGGFAGRPAGPSIEGGTNSTAAAVAVLAMLGSLEEADATRAAQFLATMQRDGGFAASAAAPSADLLSTFTALVALVDLGALGLVRLAPAAGFVRALRASEGGFRAHLGDDLPDIEYEYYGLGALALLARTAARGGPDA